MDPKNGCCITVQDHCIYLWMASILCSMDHDLERLAVETVGRCTSHCRPHRRHKETPASLPATRTSLAQPVSQVVAAWTRPTPTAWLMLQWQTVEPAGGVTGQGPPAQQYNVLFCGKSLKELSACRRKNNCRVFGGQILLIWRWITMWMCSCCFSGKKQDAMFYFMSFPICIL